MIPFEIVLETMDKFFWSQYSINELCLNGRQYECLKTCMYYVQFGLVFLL